LIKIDDTYKPLITGENILRYNVTTESKEFIKYGNWLGAMREERFFTSPRIIVRQIVSGKPPRIFAGYTKEPLYFTQIGFSIIPFKEFEVKYILALLNSKLITYYHKYQFLDIEKDLFQKILIANCKQLPIKIISASNQQLFVDKADLMLSISNDLLHISNSFLQLLQTKFSIEKLTKKLENWYELEYGEFLKELDKYNKGLQPLVTMKLSEQAEWMQYFNEQKQKAQTLKAEIEKTDKEIDKMVYELYGLSEEEIAIVENLTN